MSQLTSHFLNTYRNLSAADGRLRQQANSMLLQLIQTQEAWLVAKELLMSSNFQQRFLGAQLLYNKSESAVWSLQPEQLQELTSYCFKELQRESTGNGMSKQVMYMLEKAVAVCCICLIKYRSTDLLCQIVEFMKQSQGKLQVGAAMLSEIPEEIKKISNSMLSAETKNEFLSKKSEISQILVSMALKVKQSNLCLVSLLECVYNWVQLGIPLLDNTIFTEAILSIYLTDKKSFQKCSEILIEDFKNISRRSGVSLKEPMIELTSSEMASIQQLIELIMRNHFHILNEPDIRAYFAEMMEEFLLTCARVLFSNPCNISEQLLDVMLHMLKSKDLETSHYSVRFWSSFYNQIKKITVHNQSPISQMCVKYYKIVYEIARTNCSLANRPSADYGETDISIETQLMDVVCSGQNGSMTFKEYRTYFVDFFQSIYKLFVDCYGGQEGNLQYFDAVFELLKQFPHNSDSLHRIELALFLTKSINELCVQEGKKSVATVLSCLPSLSGINKQVKRQSLMLIVCCCRQIADNPMLLPQIAKYILSSLAEIDISSYSAYAFISLVECIRDHHMEEFANSLLQLYQGPMLESLSDESLNKFVGGHVQFILAFDSNQLRTKHLGEFLEQIVGAMGECSKGALQMKKLQNNLIRLSVVVETLDQFHSKNMDKVVYPFLYKVIHFIEITLGLCTSLTYSQSNCLGVCVKIVKNTVRILGIQSLSPNLISVIDSTIKILTTNLNENCNMLSILSCVIQCQNKRSDVLDQWLNRNIQPFIDYMIGSITKSTKLNPDLIRNFYIVLHKIIVYYPELVRNYPGKAIIEQICLKAFETIVDAHLAKQLLIFFEVYIDSAATSSQIQRLIPKVIMLSFTALPHLNIISFATLSNLLRVYCKTVYPPRLDLLLTSCKWMSNASSEQIQIMSKVLEQSIKGHNSKTIKGVLSLVASIGKGNPRHQIFQSLKRMYDAWYDQQTASD